MTEEGAETETKLKVMSYNIHGCRTRRNGYDTDIIAKIIKKSRADMVGLQEVDTGYWHSGSLRQLEILGEKTGMEGIAGPTLRDDRGEYGNAILTRWPVLDVRLLDISVPGREPRGVILTKLQVHGRNVNLINTHLGLKRRERRLQAEIILDLLANEKGTPCVLTGDFNEWFPFGKVFRMFKETLLGGDALRSFPARNPILMLDRIWVSPTGRVQRIETLIDSRTRIASDHLPVLAEIKF